MPRKPLIRTSEFPYHVTNRSNNKEFFYLSLDDLWLIFMDQISNMIEQFHCEVHAFVLMSNHYHLIISTPKSNLNECMKYLHREVARKANQRAQRINHFFGGRYKWCLIDSEEYYWNAVKYLFQNPLKAGLSERVERYKYSSLNTSCKAFAWRMVDFFWDRDKLIQLDLNWLNEHVPVEQSQRIGSALRRCRFEMPVNKNGRKPRLEAVQRKKGTITGGDRGRD